MKHGSIRAARVRHFVVGVGLLSPAVLSPVAQAVNAVAFSPNAVGVTKSIAQWGKEVAWPSYDNMRLTLDNMGASNMYYVPIPMNLAEAPNADGTLTVAAKSSLDYQISLGLMAGNQVKFELGGGLPTNSAYFNSDGTANTATWVKNIIATKAYIESKGGTVNSVMPFNEPDYTISPGTIPDLHAILLAVKNTPALANLDRVGASTLFSTAAQTWWDGIKDVATHGSTHVLSVPPYSTATAYANFFTYVAQTGGTPTASELHGLGEAMVAADRGVVRASWWGAVLRGRGQFVKTSQGKRLAYSENLANHTAGAVYRGPDGSLRAFVGGFERYGNATAYKFTSADKDVYVNGVGPLREYTINGGQGSEAYADIQTNAAKSLPPLDGYRWKIVNAQTGQSLEVAGASTADGGVVRTAADTGATSQRWDIVRTPDGYYELYNANSGRTAEIAGGSIANGGLAQQYGHADNLIQHWYLDPTSTNGNFYLRNGNSSKYLFGSATQGTQGDLNASTLQQWKFVLDNPTRANTSRYTLAGNVNDTGGTNNATAVGSPTYVAGPTNVASTAVKLNGTSQYVQLPGGVASGKDITLSASVKWDGGGNFQRIFDFGNSTASYMFLTPKSGDGTMRFAITNNGSANEQILDTVALAVGQWVNLSLTLGGNTAVLYVNGRAQSAATITLNPSDIASTLNYLGKSQFAADPLFAGSISDFRIFDYALSATQVQDLNYRPVTWVGGGSNVWDAGTTANFKLATNAATAFYQGDGIAFDGTGTNAVTITGDVAPRSIAVSGTANLAFTGTGTISGPAAITKTGSGTLTLANPAGNGFTGGVTINGGTVVAAATNALGTGPITLNNGTLTTANTNGTTPTLVNDIVVAGNGSIAAGSGTATRLNGDVSGSGTLALSGTFNGAGLTLAGNNAGYTGTVTVTGANTRLGAATSGSAAANWVVNGNLQTDVTGGASFDLGSLAGTGTITGHAINTTAVTSTLVVGANGGTTTFSGRILDNALNDTATGNADGATNNVLALTKVGTGTLTLAGANAYTGPTYVKAGTLNVTGVVNSPASVVSVGHLDNGNGTLTVRAAAVVTGDQVWFGNGDTPTNLATGTGTIFTGGTVNSTRWAVVGRSGKTGSAGTLGVSGGTLNVRTGGTSGDLEVGVFDSAAGTLNVNAGAVNLLNSASLRLGSVNTVANATVNHNGGAVTFYSNNGTTPGGNGSLVLGGGSSSGTYTYNLSGGTLIVPTITKNTTNAAAKGILNFNGGTLRPTQTTTNFITNLTAANVQNGGAIIDTNTFDATIAQPLLAASVNGGLTKTGAGTLTLTGANTYTGPTTVTAGTLRVAYSSTAPSAATPLLTGNTDLQTGRVVFDYTASPTPAAVIRLLINNGQLYSTTATATRTLGYADNGTNSVTVMATLYGDTDLDSGVAIGDFNTFAANFGVATGKVWTDGDFDYDGGVGINDFNLLAANFGQSLTAGVAAGGAAVDFAPLLAFAAAHDDLAAFQAATGVPEPTSAAALAAGATLALRRRRRCA